MHLFRSCFRHFALACLAAIPLIPTAQAISPNFTALKTFDRSGSEPLASPVQGPGGFLYAATYQGGANSVGTVFKVRPDGSGYAVLYTFTTIGGSDGNLPWGVIVGSDGALYGSTDQGGNNHVGTLFKLQPDGTGYSVLHRFTGSSTDGSRPFCVPVQGPSGLLYGTTYAGGTSNLGTIYKMATDGSGFTILHSFAGGTTDGSTPLAELTVANDGNLYGVAQGGGAFAAGVVFKLHPDGSGYTILHSFQSVPGDGVNPKKRLIQATDGALYGTTPGLGILYKLNLDGSGYTIVHSFSTTGSPEPGVIQANDGKLYGATQDGGTAFRGSVYKINLDGTGYTVLRSFLGGNTDAWMPASAMIQASDGALYGASRFGGTPFVGGSLGPGAIYKLNLDGSGATTPFILPRAADEGGTPLDGFIQASDGTLYATTSAGGSAGNGTVMKIQPDGSGFAVLHSFLGAGDGALPSDGLVEATDGALYGVTPNGGASNSGTIFKIQRSGAGYSVLHSFTNGASDGGSPHGRLVQGSDGALYGTTYYGGTALAGTVFKVNLDGSGYTLLYSFSAPGSVSDGMNPNGGVFEANDGRLYGTTRNGGTVGAGVVFRLMRDGSAYSIVHNFTGGQGDFDSRSRLIQGSDGALYGTAYGFINFYGGVSDYGCVFKLNPDGSGYRVIRTFAGGNYDGGFPGVKLIKAANGSLYGATNGGNAYYGGGTIGNGSLFRVNEDGTGYSELYAFTGGDSDGYIPTALVQASNGDFYGMTYGTATHSGLIFRATLADLAPVAVDQSLSVAPSVATPITLSATDGNSDALTYITASAPASGTLTGTGANLSYNSGGFTGGDSLTYVAFDGYVFSNLATVTLNVGTAAQTITFPPIASHVFGDAPFTIGATASSGLPVTFAILSGPASISGNTVTITGAGSVTVQAAQAGNASFSAVTANQSVAVAPATASVVLSNLTAAFDGSAKPATATTAPSGLATYVTYNGSASAPNAAGSYAVFATITDPNYSGATSGTLTITGGAPPVQAPSIALQPAGQLLTYGGSVNLSVTAFGTAPLGYQWYRDGVLIVGANSANYAATIVGTYTVVVNNAAGAVTSAPAIVISASRLANVSGRAHVAAGDSALILGLVVNGQPGVTKQLLVRAVGPTLAQYGIPTALAQPRLTVYSGSTAIGSNTGWGSVANPAAVASAAAMAGAFPFATGSADSALLLDLLPGTYSVVITSATAAEGIALAEAYELDNGAGQLANLSARVHTGAGDDTAIVGFCVSGPQPAKVLIRGVGPALAGFGVSGALQKPQLNIYSNGVLIGSNQGWGTASDPAALAAAAVSIGAFPFQAGSDDSAIILTLAPGTYSALVNGAGNTSGITLVEVYQLP
ncbi:MAG: type sorting protein [Verrucomicrobia bacterium]|nr:type sorting protein [Verrucomicrobiota bacterium]